MLSADFINVKSYRTLTEEDLLLNHLKVGTKSGWITVREALINT